MPSDPIEGIDWIQQMRLWGEESPESFSERLPQNWIKAQCRVAARLALASGPSAKDDLADGKLQEETFSYVVCQMVLRKARYQAMKSENDGSYQYTNVGPQQADGGYSPSPNLYISKTERTLLAGQDGDRTPLGSVSMETERIWTG